MGIVFGRLLLFILLLATLPAGAEIRLHIEVEPRYLLLHTLAGRMNPRYKGDKAVIRDFQKLAVSKDVQACKFLLRYGYPVGSLADQGPMGVRAEHLIEEMMAQESFQLIIRETQEAAERVEAEWSRDYAESYLLMSALTGLDLDLDCTVLITHPAQLNGRSWRSYLGQSKRNILDYLQSAEAMD